MIGRLFGVFVFYWLMKSIQVGSEIFVLGSQLSGWTQFE